MRRFVRRGFCKRLNILAKILPLLWGTESFALTSAEYCQLQLTQIWGSNLIASDGKPSQRLEKIFGSQGIAELNALIADQKTGSEPLDLSLVTSEMWNSFFKTRYSKKLKLHLAHYPAADVLIERFGSALKREESPKGFLSPIERILFWEMRFLYEIHRSFPNEPNGWKKSPTGLLLTARFVALSQFALDYRLNGIWFPPKAKGIPARLVNLIGVGIKSLTPFSSIHIRFLHSQIVELEWEFISTLPKEIRKEFFEDLLSETAAIMERLSKSSSKDKQKLKSLRGFLGLSNFARTAIDEKHQMELLDKNTYVSLRDAEFEIYVWLALARLSPVVAYGLWGLIEEGETH